MTVRVISDLHSATDALKSEVSSSDQLLLLGDLVNVIDYKMMDGVLVEVFGVDAVQEVIDLRAQGRFDEARATMARRREGREQEVGSLFGSLIRREYEQVFASLPEQTYLILGNVDSPVLVGELAPDTVRMVDGQVIELLGLRIGFVGGGLPTPLKIQGEIPEEEYNEKLFGLGPVDVVCSHVPPDIKQLTYDVIADRHEAGSRGLVEYVKKYQPRKVLYGHIHQPMVSSMHLGGTHLLNCGYFRRTRRALTLEALLR